MKINKFGAYLNLIPLFLVLGLIFIQHNTLAAVTSCPSTAVNSITITGTAQGAMTQANCAGGQDCSLMHTVYEISQMRYTIDGGSGVNFTSWGQVLPTGASDDCTPPCDTYERFHYTFNPTINTSSLAAGSHTIIIQGYTNGTWAQQGTCIFTRVTDTTAPTADIQYPCNSSYGSCDNATGWQNSSTIYVNLAESDNSGGSGINTSDGNVDVNIYNGSAWGGWVSTGLPSSGTTINNFSYTGTNCYYYRFRYRVSDNAGNLSAWDDPGWQTRIDTVSPTANISYPAAGESNPRSNPSFTITLIESDACSGVASGVVQYKSKSLGAAESNWTTWALLQNTINDFTYTGSNHTCYLFRYQTTDVAGNNSTWSDPGTRVCIDIPSANNPPNVPTLLAPPNNTWINYNPTFQATVSDPDAADTVKAIFEVSGFGTGTGSTLANNGPGTSSWGAVVIADGDWNWRAKAQDSLAAESAFSGYWLMRKDTIAPIPTIDQENGTSADTSIWVNLTETDERSGIAEGDVDVRINGGSWVDTGLPNAGSTIDNFTYTGTTGNTYEFRYRVRDNANNWSGYVYDGSIVVNINRSPTATNLQVNNSSWCSTTPANFFSWTYSDPDSNPESRFEFQVDSDSGFTAPISISRDYSGLSNPSPFTNNQSAFVVPPPPAVDQLTYGLTYYWRVRVYDNNGANSGWINGSAFATPAHRYPICDFTYSPTYPNPDEDVDFNDNSTCYDNVAAGSVCSTTTSDTYLWTINNGNPSSSVLENVTSIFSAFGTNDVTLRVTDSVGYSCSTTKQVRINLPLPRWREIKPF